MSQLVLDFGPPPAPTLGNFVPGRNRECLAALRGLAAEAQAEAPTGAGTAHRFTYVWGPAGSGKSHLAAALRAQAVPGLTVVDDCQRLDAEAQARLFHAFDRLAQAPGERLVVFGDQPPARLPVMPELASRLAWGIVFALEPLDDADLRRAIEAAAHARGIVFPPEVSGYLLRHTRRDMGSLKALLDALDRLSLEQKRPVTVALLRELLAARADATAAPEAAAGPDRMAG